MKVNNPAKLILLPILAVIFLLIFVSFSPWGQVDSGFMGLKLSFGRVVSEPLGAGLWFYNPIGGKLVTYDCREMRYDFTMNVYTKDVQTAALQIYATYAIDKTRLVELHNEYGRQYIEKILTPAIIGATKNIIGTWEADKLISGREEATKQIFSYVTEQLRGKPLTISSIVIANIDYSNVFEKAIEDKQVAMQNAIRAKNKTQEIEELARQKVIAAEAEAKAMQIKGDALKSNQALVPLEAIQKWDGRAPATLVIGGEQAQTLLNLSPAK